MNLGGKPMNPEKAEQLIRERLSPKRLQHTFNVRDMALELAKIHQADLEKVEIAALLHDAAKEMPKADMLQIFEDNAIMAENAPQRPQPVWHGICAAILAKTQWGIEDEEILAAIRYHTTGRVGMSKLEKIIFLADMTSADRNYPQVDSLRTVQKEDLSLAMEMAMQFTIDWVKQRGGELDPLSLQVLQQLRSNHREGDSAV